MKSTFVKPSEGLKVRDPLTKKALPVAGASVILSTYWRRRLKDGSVVLVKPTAEKTETPKPDKKTVAFKGGE